MITGAAAGAVRQHAPAGHPINLTSGLRYDALLEYIAPRPSLSILEIGVARAAGTLRMLGFADRLGGRPQYTGIDLFGRTTDQLNAREHNSEAKRPRSLVDTLAMLTRVLGERIAERIDLREGYSQEILPELRREGRTFDLIFIDGGHSYEAVHGDWQHGQHLLAEGGTIVMDDFPNWGVLPTVAAIDPRHWRVRLLPRIDVFGCVPTAEYPADRRMFQLVEVTRHQAE